jgi:hypothetical protein
MSICRFSADAASIAVRQRTQTCDASSHGGRTVPSRLSKPVRGELEPLWASAHEREGFRKELIREKIDGQKCISFKLEGSDSALVGLDLDVDGIAAGSSLTNVHH